jgi:hypothetical protein
LATFYFRSYSRIIGKADDTRELDREISRLAWENPAALAYHLDQGHIASWLESIGEADLAQELRTAHTIYEVQMKLAKYNERMTVFHRMQTGRMH